MKYFALVTRESSPGSGVAVKEDEKSLSFQSALSGVRPVTLQRTSLHASEEKSLSRHRQVTAKGNSRGLFVKEDLLWS